MLPQLLPYAPLFAALFGVLAMFARKAAPSGHFFHTPTGVVLLSLMAGLANAGEQWFASGQLTSSSLIALAAGAIAGAAGALSPAPSLPSGTPSFTALDGGKSDGGSK